MATQRKAKVEEVEVEEVDTSDLVKTEAVQGKTPDVTEEPVEAVIAAGETVVPSAYVGISVVHR